MEFIGRVIQFKVLFCTGEVMAIFPKSKIKMAAAAICLCKNDNFDNTFYYRVSFCTSVPNLMRISASTV